MLPNKAKYISGCFQVYGHHKIEWKEDWFECEYVLNYIKVQNWTSRHMSQIMEYWWAILPNWVLPNRHHQIMNSMSPGLQCELLNSTSYCGLPECSLDWPEWTPFQVAHCQGWFRTLSVLFGHNNNNNNHLQFNAYTHQFS